MRNRLSALFAVAGLAAMEGTGPAAGFPRFAQTTGRDPRAWQLRREASHWNTPEIERHNANVTTRQVLRRAQRKSAT